MGGVHVLFLWKHHTNMSIAKFPVELEISYGKIFIPSLMKLQEHWIRESDQNKQIFRKHFLAQGVDVDKLVAEPGAYQTEGEIPYQPLSTTEPKRSTSMHSYYHELAESQHRIQRDLK